MAAPSIEPTSIDGATANLPRTSEKLAVFAKELIVKKSLLSALAVTSCLLGAAPSMAVTIIPLNTATAFTYNYIVGTDVVVSFLFDEPNATAIDIDLGSHGSGVFGFDSPVVAPDTGFTFPNGAIDLVYFGGFQPEPPGSDLSVLSILYSATESGSVSGTYTFVAVPEPATWAMMLVGLGMIGFAARRRRVDVTYA